jgi:hypothetical protein
MLPVFLVARYKFGMVLLGFPRARPSLTFSSLVAVAVAVGLVVQGVAAAARGVTGHRQGLLVEVLLRRKHYFWCPELTG